MVPGVASAIISGGATLEKRYAWPGLDSIFLDGVGLSFLICFNINDYSRRLDHRRIAAAMVQNPTQPPNYP